MTIGSGSGLLQDSTQPAGVLAAPIELSTRARLRTARIIDWLTIGAIVLVVVLVSIPRLRAFAVRANELDAMHMLQALAAQPAPAGHEAMGGDLALLVHGDAALRQRLEDLECLDDGRLRRHGYLFDMTMLRPGEPMLRAWPWNHGQTGLGAFVWTPQRGLLGLPNLDGTFSGPHHPPRTIGRDWLRIPRR